MNNNLEKLNRDYIDAINSKEYLLGKKIIESKKILKKFKFIKLVKKLIINKKISKLNAHSSIENNYEFDFVNGEKPRIVVYSCITGNYDKQILEPLYVGDNVDFIMFTDTDIKSDKWIIKSIPKKLLKYNNVLINRYIKMHPHEFFKKYDYSIYVDGNVQVISDVTNLTYSCSKKTGISMHRHQFRDCIYNEIKVCKLLKKGNYEKMKIQTDRYFNEGFPKHFGMMEATIIVTDLKNKISRKIFDDWWLEFSQSESFRDQIALHYVIWKNNFGLDDFGSLGNNLYRNPKFRINIHK